MSTPQPGFAEDAPTAFATAQPAVRYQRVQIGKAGRIVIPAAVRAALGVKEGEWLTLELRGNEVTMLAYMETLRRVQAYFVSTKPPGVSVVDELIEERRAEGTLSDEEFREWLIARSARDEARKP